MQRKAITWTQKKLLAAYARCNMNRRKTAEQCFLSVQDVDYHLRMVEVKTGLNPHNFIDLVKLLYMCGEGNMLNLEDML